VRDQRTGLHRIAELLFGATSIVLALLLLGLVLEALVV
jgi:hypothetical protein